MVACSTTYQLDLRIWKPAGAGTRTVKWSASSLALPASASCCCCGSRIADCDDFTASSVLTWVKISETFPFTSDQLLKMLHDSKAATPRGISHPALSTEGAQIFTHDL